MDVVLVTERILEMSDNPTQDDAGGERLDFCVLMFSVGKDLSEMYARYDGDKDWLEWLKEVLPKTGVYGDIEAYAASERAKAAENQEIDWSIDVRYAPDLETAFNRFIQKWCSSSYPHLIDSDDNDGQFIRNMIASERRKERERIGAAIPKRIPDKFFAKDRDDSPWSMGYNDAINVCRAVIAEGGSREVQSA